jgi:hypothetical protein
MTMTSHKLADVVVELHDIARAAADPSVSHAIRVLADAAAALVKEVKQMEMK